MTEKEKRKTGMKSTLWRDLALMLAILLIPPLVSFKLIWDALLSERGNSSQMLFSDWQAFYTYALVLNSLLPITITISILGYIYLIRHKWFFVFGLIPQLVMIAAIFVFQILVYSVDLLGTVEYEHTTYYLVQKPVHNAVLELTVCETNQCQVYVLAASGDAGILISSPINPSRLNYDVATGELVIFPVVSCDEDYNCTYDATFRIKPADLEHWNVRYYGSLWDERKSEA